MTVKTAQPCGCIEEIWSGKKARRECEHGNPFLGKQLDRSAGVGVERLVRSSREARGVRENPGVGVDSSAPKPRPARRKSIRRGQGLSASPVQRAKVRDLPCINCGRDRFEITITAMHVYPRRFAACSCAEGVVSGCVECHPIYEEKGLDLLPLLVAHGFRKELVHAVLIHDAPIFHVLEIVTGTPWVPKLEMAA